jgi:hypothetical protein
MSVFQMELNDFPHFDLTEDRRLCSMGQHCLGFLRVPHRKQVVSQPIHKSDIIQGEAVVFLDGAGTEHLTPLVIPKSHILLV